MSFDLNVFPPTGPTTLGEIHRMQETDEGLEGSPGNDSSSPDPEMAAFIAELERRWPTLEGDPSASPWSSSLWLPPAGAGTELNIQWQHAEAMRPAILKIAARANVIVYDPQADDLVMPAQGNPISRLFKRRG